MRFQLAALASVVAVSILIGGTVTMLALKPQEGDTSVVVENLHQHWYAHGPGRGKLLIFNAEKRVVRTLEVVGHGKPDTVDVVVTAMKGPHDNQIDRELNRFKITKNEHHIVRDAQGKEIASATFVPFQVEEEEWIKATEERRTKRGLDLYRNPSCITIDTIYEGGGGYFTGPGLIAWALDCYRDEKGYLKVTKDNKAAPLENGGYAWKVYGDAQVTMTLLTNAAPYIRTYRSADMATRIRYRIGGGEMANLIPEPGSEPRIYWYQSAGFPINNEESRNWYQQEILTMGHSIRYPIDRNGAFLKLKRSGEFHGYGKHTVTDENGKPVLILDVTPLTESKETR